MSTEPETLYEFLNSYTVDTLKRLAALFEERAPTRKAELVEFIHARVLGEAALRQLWATLDQLQQAAVAETLYHPQLLYDAGRFRAKYGGDPDWGSRNRWSQLDKPARLGLFLHQGRLPGDVAARLRAFVSPPAPAAINYLSGAQWSDRAPKLVQARLVDSFRNSGRVRSVGMPSASRP